MNSVTQNENNNYNVDPVHERFILALQKRIAKLRLAEKDLDKTIIPQILEIQEYVQNFNFKVIVNNVTNVQNNKLNEGIPSYISKQYDVGLEKKKQANEILQNISNSNKKLNSIRAFCVKSKDIASLNTNINKEKLKDFKEENSSSISSIESNSNAIISKIDENIQGINESKIKLQTELKKYLFGIRKEIYNKIFNFYNIISNQKFELITSDINKLNGNSKNILEINKNIIKDIASILGWTKSIKTILDSNIQKTNGNYTNFNESSKKELTDTLATIENSIKDSYLEKTSSAVNKFKDIYSKKVEEEIDTLVNTVADLKSQLLELVTKVTTSKTLALNSLGEPYVINGIPVLDNVTETIGKIMPVKQDIMRALGTIISKIQETLEIPADSAVEGVVVPGSVPANTAGNGAQAQVPTVNSLMGKKVTVPGTEYGSPRRNGVIASTAFTNGRLGVKIGNSPIITPFQKNQITFVNNIIGKTANFINTRGDPSIPSYGKISEINNNFVTLIDVKKKSNNSNSNKKVQKKKKNKIKIRT